MCIRDRLYALRTEAERYNSRFKQTGQERLWVHSFDAAQNLNSVAHIALLAVCLLYTSCFPLPSYTAVFMALLNAAEQSG